MNAQRRHQVQTALHYWRQKTKELGHREMMWLDERHGNVRQVVEWGLQDGELWQDTAVLIIQLFHFMEWGGYWLGWITTLETAVAHCEDRESYTYARLHSQLGQLYRLDRRFADAEQQYQIVLQQATQLQNEGLFAAVYREMGQCYLSQNRLAEAEKFALLALEHNQKEPENGRLTAFILQTLGIIKRLTGQYEAALAYLEPALKIRRDLQEFVLLADILNEIALTYGGLQSYDIALQLIEEALQIIEETTNKNMQYHFIIDKGVFYYRQNRLAEAESVFQQVDFFALKRNGDMVNCALAMQNLGNVLLKQGKLVEAEPYIREAIQLFRPTQDEVRLANSLGTLAEILLAQNQIGDAKTLFDEAIALLEKYPENVWGNKLKADFMGQREAI